MPPAFRHQNSVTMLTATIVVFSAVLAGVYMRTWHEAQGTSVAPVLAPSVPVIPSFPALTGTSWMALQARPGRQTGAAAGSSGQAADQYRLAGTFSIEGAGEPTRRAIVDSLAKRDQFIVSEGDRLDELSVEKIYVDHVTLRGQGGSFDIWVEFASKATVAATSVTNAPGVPSAGMTNRFGCVQTQENRWKFSRKPLLDYYQALLDEPDRMVAVFDTMKPVRDERNKITGYVVGLEGEKEFFDAVGLHQGDIVRAVNSLPMTNRKRAEAFIDQFLKDQMNAVVLEVERGGKVTKQIYQLQP